MFQLFRFFRLVLATILPAVSYAQIAYAQVTLAEGDRVALKVIGAAELDTTATIDMDGYVKFPVSGRVLAAGLTVEEVEARLVDALSRQPLRLVGARGEAVWLKLEPSAILLTVAEYRPVYVTGLVRNGGVQPFRPGMTVRQALVLAGGPGRNPDALTDADFARLMSERNLLEKQRSLAAEDVGRFDAELALIESLEADAVTQARQVAEDEQPESVEEWLSARANFLALNNNSAELTLAQMEDRLTVLGKLEEVTSATLKTFEEDFERAMALAERGVVTANAVTEAQRGLLSFSTRALETTSEAYRVRTDIARTKERTSAALAEQRVEALASLLRSQRELQEVEARLDALDMQLAFLGEAGFDQAQAALSPVIYRSTAAEEISISASFNTMILPGDVIEFNASETPTAQEN